MPKPYTPPQAFETTPRPPIQLARVKSSQVAAIGYDPETRTLAMQFTSRAKTDSSGPLEAPVYHYPNVDPETHAALVGVGADPEKHSIGIYFGANIKRLSFRKYPAEPLPPEA